MVDLERVAQRLEETSFGDPTPVAEIRRAGEARRRRKRWRAAGAGAIALAVVIAAVVVDEPGHASKQTVSLSGGSGPRNAHVAPSHFVKVTGTLQEVGGPAPGSQHPLSGTVRFISPTSKTYTVSSRSDGTFSLLLPAGRYNVSGRSPSYLGGKGRCTGGDVVVSSARTMKVTVSCQVK